MKNVDYIEEWGGFIGTSNNYHNNGKKNKNKKKTVSPESVPQDDDYNNIIAKNGNDNGRDSDDDIISPSQLKYFENKSSPSPRAQMINRMLEHGKVVDQRIDSRRRNVGSFRKNYKNIFKRRIKQVNSFGRYGRQTKAENETTNKREQEDRMSPQSVFSNDLATSDEDKEYSNINKTRRRSLSNASNSSIKNRRRSLSNASNVSKGEKKKGILTNRNGSDVDEVVDKNDPYYYDRSASPFSYPTSPRTNSPSSFSQNSPNSPLSTTSVGNNEHPSYFSANKHAAKIVRRNQNSITNGRSKRLVQKIEKKIEKKMQKWGRSAKGRLAKQAKEEEEAEKARIMKKEARKAKVRYTKTHDRVPVSSNQNLGLYRKRNAKQTNKRKKNNINIGKLNANENNVPTLRPKTNPMAKNKLFKNRLKKQNNKQKTPRARSRSPPPPSLKSSRIPSPRPSPSPNIIIREVEEKINDENRRDIQPRASIVTSPQSSKSSTSPIAQHHGPFLAAPRVKRKDSMLSTPSGMPVESVYNVRNEKADGKYAGKHSRRGVEYVDHLFESDDRLHGKKKRYSNYLKRGEGLKKQHIRAKAHKKIAQKERQFKEYLRNQRNYAEENREEKSNNDRTRAGYRGNYTYTSKKSGKYFKRPFTKRFKHNIENDIDEMFDDDDLEGSIQSRISFNDEYKYNADPETWDETTTRRRARDIDPHDYQGGDGEFDEIIKRWKERRNSSNVKIDSKNSKKKTNNADELLNEEKNGINTILTPDTTSRKRPHNGENATKLRFHLKFDTLYTYDERGSVIPPWRRERLESQIPRIIQRRVKIIRPMHGGPPQWILYHDYGMANNNNSSSNNSSLYDQQKKLSDSLNRHRYKLNQQDEKYYNRFNHQQQQLHPRRGHSNAILINSSQAAVIYAQIRLLKKYFEMLVDYTSRTRWEKACINALCERRAETHLPFVFNRWHSMYRAVRWHRLRLLSVSIMNWKEYTIESQEDYARMTHARIYFRLKHSLHGIRRWREYTNRKIVMNELKERADMYHRHFIKRTFFKKWNIASISSAMNKEKLEYAIDNDRWRVLFYAFNTMKENVGICVLIKLLDLRRDENLMKNMFFLWYSKTQTDTFVDDRVEKAELYHRLKILGRVFWAWENNTSGHLIEMNATEHFVFQSKRRAIKQWYNFTLSHNQHKSKTQAARYYYRIHKLQLLFRDWKEHTKSIKREDQAAMFHDLRRLIHGVHRWNDFLQKKKEYRVKEKKAMLQYLFSLFRRLNRRSDRIKKERFAAEFAIAKKKKKGLKLLFQNSKRNIKERAQLFVANAFLRRTTLTTNFSKWNLFKNERIKMFDNIQLSKQHYRKTLREKGFRGFRLQVVESNEMLKMALQLKETHDSAKIQHYLHFWHWWAHRDRAISQYFFQRRIAIIFVGWRRYVETRRMEKESFYLAKLHFKSNLLYKLFHKWRDVTTTLLLRRQVTHGAIVWGNRKLLSRKLRNWRKKARSMAVYRGKVRIAKDFARLVLLNKVLINWQAIAAEHHQS